LEQIEDKRQKKKKILENNRTNKIYKSTLATKIRQFFYAPNNPSFYT